MDWFEIIFGTTILGMSITSNSSSNFFILFHDLSSNLKNLIFTKTLTPHYWRHDARKVALTPEMWCRPDCLKHLIMLLLFIKESLRHEIKVHSYWENSHKPPSLNHFMTKTIFVKAWIQSSKCFFRHKYWNICVILF